MTQVTPSRSASFCIQSRVSASDLVTHLHALRIDECVVSAARQAAPTHLLRGFEMTAVVAHDGGHALIVVIGVLVAGVLAAVAWVRSR